MNTLRTSVNGLEVLLARAKGQGHVYNGKPCQDYCFVKRLSDDVTLLAVADGHGGARYIYSDEGSYTICHTLADLVAESLDDIGSIEWCQTLKNRWDHDVIDLHEEKEVMLYGTTLLFAVITPDELIVGQLGDGAILLFNEKQAMLHKTVHPKQSSITHSMAESHSQYYWYIERYDRFMFTDILLSTDGVFDTLKTENQFAFYALGLKTKFLEGDINQPFDYYGQNIMDYTFDDCSIVYALLSQEDHSFDMGEAAMVTSQKGLVMYETDEAIIRVRDTFVPLKQAPYIITPSKVEQSGDYYIYTYPKHADQRLVVDCYYFDDIHADGQQDFKDVLPYFRGMDELNHQLLKRGLQPTEYFYKSLVINKQNHLSVYLDALKGKEIPWHSPLLGTLIVNDQTYPLLDYFNEGGFSPIVCRHGTQIPLYCTINHKEMDLIGIYNVSSEPWHIIELDCDCEPGMVLPLNRIYHMRSGKEMMILIPVKGE